jgi:hypothetical protein
VCVRVRVCKCMCSVLHILVDSLQNNMLLYCTRAYEGILAWF